MDDKALVQTAYETTFAAIYKAFFEAYTSASGDKQKEAEAEARFQSGVIHIRHIRDRALGLLGSPAASPKRAPRKNS